MRPFRQPDRMARADHTQRGEGSISSPKASWLICQETTQTPSGQPAPLSEQQKTIKHVQTLSHKTDIICTPGNRAKASERASSGSTSSYYIPVPVLHWGTAALWQQVGPWSSWLQAQQAYWACPELWQGARGPYGGSLPCGPWEVAYLSGEKRLHE